VSQLGNNLGYDDIGWLNQESEYWPGPGAFITDADLQNLQNKGLIDPGWIFFGKYTAGDFDASSSSKSGLGTYNYASDLISLSNCKDKNDATVSCSGDDVVKGEWTYKPPATNPQQLLDMLGTDKYFDQVTVVFKSATMFAMYNFNIAALGLPPVVGTSDENYLFKGVWDMSNTLVNPGGAAGLSHISIWGRDPVAGDPPIDVPVSSPLTLAGLGLVLLGLHRRRKHLEI
jgi:MYXO-CTERM domain-containing protein